MFEKNHFIVIIILFIYFFSFNSCLEISDQRALQLIIKFIFLKIYTLIKK